MPESDPGFAQIWKAQSVAVISPTNTDMVRWVLDRGAWLPQPMTRFGATPIDSETLAPNRDTVTSDGQGGFQAAAALLGPEGVEVAFIQVRLGVRLLGKVARRFVAALLQEQRLDRVAGYFLGHLVSP